MTCFVASTFNPAPPQSLCVCCVYFHRDFPLFSLTSNHFFLYAPSSRSFFFTRGNILTLISHSRQALDSKRSVGGLLSLLHVKVMSSHRTQPIPFPSLVWPCHCPFATTMPSKGRRTIPPTPALLFQNFYFHLFIFFCFIDILNLPSFPEPLLPSPPIPTLSLHAKGEEKDCK